MPASSVIIFFKASKASFALAKSETLREASAAVIAVYALLAALPILLITAGFEQRIGLCGLPQRGNETYSKAALFRDFNPTSMAAISFLAGAFNREEHPARPKPRNMPQKTTEASQFLGLVFFLIGIILYRGSRDSNRSSSGSRGVLENLSYCLVLVCV